MNDLPQASINSCAARRLSATLSYAQFAERKVLAIVNLQPTLETNINSTYVKISTISKPY
jgi:hypothetical protein